MSPEPQASLSAATWFWLLVPMTLAIALCLLTFFTERKRDR